MIYCPGCGTANREGSRYCNQCGNALTGEEGVACPRCGKPAAPEAPHCDACGLDMARAKDGPQAGDPAEEPGEQPLPKTDAPRDEDPQPHYAREGGLPPWLDAVEWLEDGPSQADDEGVVPIDEDFEVRLPQPDWSADALPIEPAVGVPYRARERREPTLTPEQKKAAELFAKVAAEEVRAAPAEVAGTVAERRAPGNVRWLAAAALLLATLASLIWLPGPLSGKSVAPPSAAAAMQAIAELPAESPVLVAFEYDAGQAGEMQPIAEALLHPLFSRGLRVLAVSTQPEGAALAQMALDRTLAAHPGATYGKSAANLGYVPGDEAAVRALATGLASSAPVEHRGGLPLQDLAVAHDIAGAKDVPLIVVVGRDLMTVQRWIEQVAAPYGTPMVAGVPAYVEPIVGPYLTTGQLRGVVAGLSGAAACERLAGRAGDTGRMLGAVRAGAWTAGGLVILANLATLAARSRRKWSTRRRR